MLRDRSARDLDPHRTIIVVSGLPRSGTSMMMQMVAAAGLEIATDGRRVADHDNPKGYFELEAAKRIRDDASFLDACVGRAVKIVAPLLPALPERYDYRILFMERDIGEILASQSAMLRRMGQAVGRASDEALARTYRGQLARVRRWLDLQPNTETLIVSHRRVFESPGEIASNVLEFLRAIEKPVGPPADRPSEASRVAAMARVVDDSLRRQHAAAPAPA